MSEKKGKVYAVGNAHLDPVWMWRWQEGSAEAKATVRSALDRIKEYPDFKFVCSSASVFKWIEEFDPQMFEEIRERVKEGRFIIVGGWFVQPDCNLPSGEGFARQSLYSQRYFSERFGVTAKVGYNVDSFGHNGMLPQILQKSGMNRYVFMRPSPKENPLKSNLFYWVSPDGSRVLTARILDPYCFNFSKKFALSARLKFLRSKMPEGVDETMLFYGVGNHGGGPTIKNIETIIDYNKSHDDEIIFSEPSEFFDKICEKGYPVSEWKDDLQHHASGCYSAVSRVKTLNRKAEQALLEAEFFSVLGNRLINKRFPTKEISEGWETVCFNHFHDVMGGCAIKEAYADAEEFYGHSLYLASKIKNNALQSLSWQIDTRDRSKGIPIVVFNPHPFEVTGLVTVNKQTLSIVDENGNKVVTQLVFSSTNSCYGRRDTVFSATLPPLSYRTYFMPPQTFFDKNLPEIGRLKNAVLKKIIENKSSVKAYGNVLENSELKVIFDEKNGTILSLFDKRHNCAVLNKGAVPVVIDETDHDTWSHGKNFFGKQIGEFTGFSYEILEEGPIRVTAKIQSKYGDSTLTQYFSLIEGSAKLTVRAAVDWREKHRMLKLRFDAVCDAKEALYEMPFGVIARPLDGEEEPMQMWAALRDDKNNGLAVINDSKYSFSVKDTSMYLTAIRSPIYGDHGRGRASESPYTDQGISEFGYALLPISGLTNADVTREAIAFNTPFTNVLENNHEGKLPLSYSALTNTAKNVVVSAIKRSEDGRGTVIRAYEIDGDSAAATITLDGLPPLAAAFKPFSVNTYLNVDGESDWKEVLLTEF